MYLQLRWSNQYQFLRSEASLSFLDMQSIFTKRPSVCLWKPMVQDTALNLHKHWRGPKNSGKLERSEGHRQRKD